MYSDNFLNSFNWLVSVTEMLRVFWDKNWIFTYYFHKFQLQRTKIDRTENNIMKESWPVHKSQLIHNTKESLPPSAKVKTEWILSSLIHHFGINHHTNYVKTSFIIGLVSLFW
jgi:hypothetical protein